MHRKLVRIFVLGLFLFGSPIPRATAEDPVIKKVGTTYNMAQVAAWVGEEHFVVGRWDATLATFRPPRSADEFGPVSTDASMVPSAKGVEMLTPLSAQTFVTSNDAESLAVWVKRDARFFLQNIVEYSSTYGTANSGAVVQVGGKEWLISGHSEGYLLIWEIGRWSLRLHKAVSLRSSAPIPNPFRLWNIRGIVPWQNGIVVTGGEDGDLCMVQIPTGDVLHRMRYNATAQRGINSLAISSDLLAVANCSVGSADKNTWLFRLQPKQFLLQDSLNLRKDASRAQVFNFSVLMATTKRGLYLFASTEEGLLWSVLVESRRFASASVLNVPVANGLGTTLAYQPKRRLLSAVGHELSLFQVEP